MIIFEPVQAAIWHCSNHYSYNTAIFLAERLYAEAPTEEALFLLATCYYRGGQTSMAYSTLKKNNITSAKGRFLLAKCCIELQNVPEAEVVLKGDYFIRNKDIAEDEVVKEFGEAASFVLQLLGLCAAKTHRFDVAILYYEKSLKLNPFLWESYTELCNLGSTLSPDDVFTFTKIDDFRCCHGVNPLISLVNETYENHSGTPHNMDAPLKKTPMQINLSGNQGTCSVRLFVTAEETVPMTPDSLGVAYMPTFSSMKSRKTRLRSMLSPIPTFGVLPFKTESKTPMDNSFTIMSPEIIHKPARRVLLNETPLQASVFTQSGNTDTSSPPRPSVRRSSRLFSSSVSVKENSKSPKHSKFVSPKSPSRKSKKTSSAKTITNYNDIVTNNEKNKTPPIESPEIMFGRVVQFQKDSAEGLMTLLRTLGWATLYLAKFECKKAIEVLTSLPSSHNKTGWVQGMIARAYFEQPDYHNSLVHFRRMRDLDPDRVTWTELFSSALWFLQREVELSALSQHLVSVARHSPQTWCVAANCFSLHKEHETAIKFLHRAIQVDLTFGYAYTLLGHEYLASEDLDKALTCFRNAIRISPRDYSAYFGLGSVYSKQEKFELAHAHYAMAEKINPQNVVILCHIGVVENAQHRPESALEWFAKALSYDPLNPLCKFQRANVYFNMGRHTDALNELEELKNIVPKESSVFYLMGKIYKKMGETDKALMHFNWAMDLDPKATHTQIKESIHPSLSRASDHEATAGEPEQQEIQDQEQNESDASF